MTAAVESTLRARDLISTPPSDSLVFQALPDLHVIEGRAGGSERSLLWSEYWAQVDRVREVLSEAQSSGWYEPDILLGISNGGLLLADTLLRLVYRNDTPLLCLWARRSDLDMFANPVNDALVCPEIVRSLADGRRGRPTLDRPFKILVLDDIVSTGRTSRELLRYLKHRLGDLWGVTEIRVLFLYTPVRARLSELGDTLLWEDRRFPESQRSILRQHVFTSRDELPYRKSIHSGETIEATGAR